MMVAHPLRTTGSMWTCFAAAHAFRDSSSAVAVNHSSHRFTVFIFQSSQVAVYAQPVQAPYRLSQAGVALRHDDVVLCAAITKERVPGLRSMPHVSPPSSGTRGT